ncbi:quinohemoprotein amine dehydrogenase subunit alpha [Novosphingobium sp.]|uniref:quinohemoprotein amine dehydrogenase subunit alpha n=1 Tax=Novosphingobium sp. TaxID=1874826 RepID=UPI003D12B77E
MRKVPRGARLLMVSAALITASAVAGQSMSGGAGMASASTETEDGIPVTDAMTREKCGTCHTADAKGNLSRISWIRTTPEGWDQAIKRMVRLNGAQVSPEEARHIIHYLGSAHGLAPEEARPVAYVPEKRMIDETNIPSESVRGSCAACHAFGQPLSWRRSSHEWKLLQDFHVALYSQADSQYRRAAIDEPGEVFGQTKPVVNKPGSIPLTQGEVALAYLRKVAPLHTPEWTAWSAREQTPHLAGKWLVSASLPGRGQFFGTMEVAPGSSGEIFGTRTTLQSLAGGPAITTSGNGVVYGGYAWRGRAATGVGGKPAADSFDQPMREVMLFSADRKTATGRWFWGEYQEFGYDVTLTRADGAPVIGGISGGGILAGARGQTLTIFGDAFPAGLTARDIDLGKGLMVSKIVSASPSQLVLSVDAAPGVTSGVHDVTVGTAVLSAALPVYHHIAYIKVMPETSLARLGGAAHPAGFGQFEAYGYDAGPDGKPYTADDVKVGVVDADYSLEEFRATWFDDDIDFVGKISKAGFFTPNLDGPNPARSGNRDNYGNVWVVATAKTAHDSTGKPLIGKAYLVVTIPSFKRIDQPEVEQ